MVKMGKTIIINVNEKTIIANNYLVPRIVKNVNFNDEEIIIPQETIKYIIDNYTNDEKGVRNLKRCIEIIYTKLNLYRLMKPGTSLFEGDISLKVEFPFTITSNLIDKIIKKEENNESYKSFYM